MIQSSVQSQPRQTKMNTMIRKWFKYFSLNEVQVGNDQEMAQSERNFHSKNRVGSKIKMTIRYLYLENIRGESKMFVDFVNKIKRIDAISLKLPYVCDQFHTNKHRKFQTNRLINIISIAICLMRVSATRSTPKRSCGKSLLSASYRIISLGD